MLLKLYKLKLVGFTKPQKESSGKLRHMKLILAGI
jgi:hypothetical protein